MPYKANIQQRFIFLPLRERLRFYKKIKRKRPWKFETSSSSTGSSVYLVYKDEVEEEQLN